MQTLQIEIAANAPAQMSGILILAMAALRLGSPHHNNTGNELYYEMPRFWTSTGFCPTGKIEHEDITATLLSAPVRQQLRHIAALPSGAITHIRIHWLLELLLFVQYTQSGTPIYDFGDLDAFLMYLEDDLGLQPVIEFMANPGNVFVNNPNYNAFLWEDFSFQITKHYLNLFGAKKVLGWRFETWNEPDLKNYNRLNFTIDDYLTYINALRRGLNAAGRRPVNSLHFQLRGPAGLFKAEENHPLCWHVLEYCNANMKQCPFDIISYHKKGNGTDTTFLIEETSSLLQKIYDKYPALKELPVSNDEADPIVDWSTPRDFQMLAHFRMNQTQPPHSQFIQKPVYAALGFLGKLAPYAAKPELVVNKSKEKLWLLKTTVADTAPLYMSWLLLPENIDNEENMDVIFESILPYKLCGEESYVYIVEVLEQTCTDPSYVWKMQQSPPYPNSTLREVMRRSQTPRLHQVAELSISALRLVFEDMHTPWIVLLRVCSNLIEILKQPQQLVVDGVTHNEVFLSWREATNSSKCLKSYEVWFRANETTGWIWISEGWHLPFPSFQYAPTDGVVNGFYMVRGADIFKRYSKFSDVVEYIEI